MRAGTAPCRLRFGPFELDTASGELWKSDARVRLQLQPSRVLVLLARQPGRLITREEIQRQVWPDGTFIDFEQSLNFCIRQIRTALHDQAATPRFVETLPRRGYRLIAYVEAVAPIPRGTAFPGEAAPRREPPSPQPPVVPGPPMGLRSRPGTRTRWEILAACLLGALLTAGYFELRSSLRRLSPPSYQRVTFGRGYLGSARFGPQQQVFYSAAWEGRPQVLYVLDLDKDARPLEWARPRLVAAPANGEIAFLDDAGTLSRVRAAGGPAKDVLEGVLAADATPDGNEFAVARTVNGRTRIEFPVGTVLGEAAFPSHLRLSPTLDRVAFLEHPVRGDDRGDVVVLDRSGQRRTLSAGWASAEGLAWSPGGDEVWFTAAHVGADSALHAVSRNGRERLVAPALGRLVLHDIARDGRVLLERNTLRLELRYRRADEPAERDLSWLDLARVVQLTPDGRGVLFVESGEGGGPEYGVYLRRADAAVPVRIGQGRAMGLSPDGSWALAIPLEPRDRILLLPTGVGETRVLRDPGIVEYEWAGFQPDGKGIVFTGRSRDALPRVFVRPLPGGTARAVTPEGAGVWSPTVAPDGRRLVAPCGRQSCLYPLDGGEPTPIPGTDSALQVVGWADARTAYVREPQPLPARLSLLDVATGRRTFWKELTAADPSGVRSINAVAVAPDGTAWAYSLSRQLSDLYVVGGLE